MYNCEIDSCNWSGAIRSKVKNKDSEYYGKKVCPTHAQELNNYLSEKRPIKKTAIKPSRKFIKSITAKTKEKKKEQSGIRDEYFKHHLLECSYSEESSKPIPSPTRANICHIFPKRKYKSVQGNILNCVYLTLEEHTKFDYLLDTYQFDKLEEFNCWKLVLSRVEKLLPEIEEEGKLKYSFEEYLNLK